MPTIEFNVSRPCVEAIVDASGYAVFSAGARGAVHVAAHRALDDGNLELGHRVLGKWLECNTGRGSQWIHLHFHMAVFELSLGKWDAAYARFSNEILAAAATTDDALTDAPGLLWRIALSARRPVELPWQPLRHRALACMRRQPDPFVQIHNLLALAGAKDVTAIERFSATLTGSRSRGDQLVERMALALRAYTRCAYREAAHRLENLIPQLPQIGGSRAQHEIFEQLKDRCWQRAKGAACAESYATAA